MADAKIADAPSFPALVQQFFTEYLLTQRAMSPHTIAAYRDAMAEQIAEALVRYRESGATLARSFR